MEATEVQINVEILDIISVDDKDFSITLSMYFSVSWQVRRFQSFFRAKYHTEDLLFSGGGGEGTMTTWENWLTFDL